MYKTQNGGPRESDEMSLNEQVFVGAIETISNDVFRGTDEEVDDGAYMDDDVED